MTLRRAYTSVFAGFFGLVLAQSAGAVPASAPPDALVLYFDSGSTAIRAQDAALLDKAARLFREGHPILMTVSGASDSTGSAQGNIRISQKRADVVFRGLVERGIPADRFQIIAKGQTDLAVQDNGAPEEKNRRVEITWK